VTAASLRTDLIGFGFSGIRVDAAKHMSPDNLAAMFAALATNMGGALPADFIAYLEVLLGGEKDLLECDYSPYDYLRTWHLVLQRLVSQ
jgi:alpha-amylase